MSKPILYRFMPGVGLEEETVGYPCDVCARRIYQNLPGGVQVGQERIERGINGY
jgi:hypothetical protein